MRKTHLTVFPSTTDSANSWSSPRDSDLVRRADQLLDSLLSHANNTSADNVAKPAVLDPSPALAADTAKQTDNSQSLAGGTASHSAFSLHPPASSSLDAKASTVAPAAGGDGNGVSEERRGGEGHGRSSPTAASRTKVPALRVSPDSSADIVQGTATPLHRVQTPTSAIHRQHSHPGQISLPRSRSAGSSDSSAHESRAETASSLFRQGPYVPPLEHHQAQYVLHQLGIDMGRTSTWDVCDNAPTSFIPPLPVSQSPSHFGSATLTAFSAVQPHPPSSGRPTSAGPFSRAGFVAASAAPNSPIRLSR